MWEEEDAMLNARWEKEERVISTLDKGMALR
jgi:hypothetical protein